MLENIDTILIALDPHKNSWPLDAKSLSFLRICGKYLIEHTLNSLVNLPIKKLIILVNNKDKKFAEKINFDKYSFKILIKSGHWTKMKDALRDVISYVSGEKVIVAHGHDVAVGDILRKNIRYTSLCFTGKDILRIFYGSSFLLSKALESESFLQYIVSKTRHTIEHFSLYPWTLLKIRDFIFSKVLSRKFIHKNSNVSKWAVISGAVYIDEEAKILRHAVLNGPVYIGKNTIIGDHTLIRNSNIEANSIIGCSMEVARSILQENVETHSGFLGDSILDENVHLGAGFVSANLRLDRKEIKVRVKDRKEKTNLTKLGTIIGRNTEVGVHVATMPGVLIGKNVFIGPGTIVFENVEDDTIYYAEFSYVKKKKKINDQIL